MTFLPILQRELRVRARSRANYWTRCAVGGVGVLITLPPLISGSPFASITALGRGAFNGLVSGAFLLCCAVCLLSADTVSRERREGTLGLLLLTRVRSFEVLLGKFASSGLASMLGLTAFLPVLMLPLLAGGVSGSEAIRTGLVLCNTLFLSLSAGLWASAGADERFRAGRNAVLAVAGLVLAPVVSGIFAKTLMLLSPLGGLFEAADTAFRMSPSRFWLSLGIVQVFAWVLLFLAMARMRGGFGRRIQWPRCFGRKLGVGASVAPASARSNSAPAETLKCSYCGMQNDGLTIYCPGCGTELQPQPLQDPWTWKPATPSTAPTPLHWLLGRARRPGPVLWLAAAINGLQFFLFGFGRAFVGMGLSLVWLSSAFGLATAAVSGSIFAWVASRFLVEARHTGELELLSTTPLGAEAIVPTQWRLLRRWMIGPVLLMAAPPVLLGLAVVLGRGYAGLADTWRTYYASSLGLRALDAVFRTGALCGVGLWCGLRASNQARAILWTLLLVEVPPYALSLGWSLFYRGIVVTKTAASPVLFAWLVPAATSLLYFLWLTKVAHRQLQKDISSAEPLSLQELFAEAFPKMARFVYRVRG